MGLDLDKRIALEKRVGRMIVEAALKQGWTVSVFDCEEWAIKRSTDRKKIVAALFSTDDDQIVFRDAAGNKTGWIHLVYGNDGWDVISDYTTNLEEFLKPINDYCDAVMKKHYRV